VVARRRNLHDGPPTSGGEDREDVSKEGFASRPGRDGIDDGVPKTLKWQDQSTGIEKGLGYIAVVDQTVDTVARGGDPSNEKCRKEQDRTLRV